jgi:hypothetical protein
MDSSVLRGVQRNHGLVESALRNGYYWHSNDVNIPDPNGALVEIPIYTLMTPFWNMINPKRGPA